MYELIEHLKNKQWVWQGSYHQTTQEFFSTGFRLLDEKLQGGFPKQGVVEVDSPSGIGELRLLMPHLRQNQQQRLNVFIQPPGYLCAEQLESEGLDRNHILFINPKTEREALWAAEQCLKSGACDNVLLWHSELEVHQARRLQVASETGRCLQFLFKAQRKHVFSLPVSLSLRLQPHEQGLEISITKRRGGWPHSSFILDMSERWPSLSLQRKTPVVIPFPMQKQG